MATDDFFRARLDTMIDMRHPLAVLATRTPWYEIEASLAPVFAHRDRKGRVVEGADLFGSTLAVAGAGVSHAGRPRLPIRLLVSLLYLKHAFNESDESLVERWSENVVWQFVSGMAYYEPKLPCDPAQISRFRRVLGEAGVERLLKTTIEAAVAMKAVRKSDFERVIVDTTVQEKAVAHPTDSRLLEVARDELMRLAKRAGLVLQADAPARGQDAAPACRRLRARQAVPSAQEGAEAPAHDPGVRGARDAAQDGHARTGCAGGPEAVDRTRRAHPHPKTPRQGQAVRAARARGRMHRQGKAKKPYEFGVKVALAITHRSGLMVGARSLPGNPYDGHTLAAQLEQTTTLLEGIGVKPRIAVVDLGYRAAAKDVEPVQVIHRGRYKTLTATQRRWLMRRQAIEPAIGHVKHDNGMDRCWLKGSEGDAVHAVLSAAGFNIRWLLRAIARAGLFAAAFWLGMVAPIVTAGNPRSLGRSSS